MTNTFTIERRRSIEVNTDPQRRCYNGCHASSEIRWTEWDWIDLEVPAVFRASTRKPTTKLPGSNAR